jgi:RHS repeat-associated protein
VTTRIGYTKTPAAIQPTQVTRVQGSSSETVSYEYDRVGNVISVSDVGGVSRYGYDAANRLTSLTDPFGQTVTFGYDNADHRTATTFPGSGTQSNVYDKSGRQTSLRFTNTAGAVGLDIRYSYTTAGGADSDLLQSKTVAGTTTAYRYDGYRRLVTAGASSYTYDNASNMTNREGLAFTVNAADQFVTAGTDRIGFDGAGNLTNQSSSNSTFSYSPTNQLVSGVANGQQIFSATYDTADQTQRRTVIENVDGANLAHTFGQSALGALQVVDNGARTSYARDSNGTLISQRTPTGTRYNLITDYQGSVLAMADSSGNLAATFSYSPYGSVTATGAAANANFFRWLGTYQLRGGANLTGYRYYNPTFGRFTQVDPTHQESNPYAYAEGDPNNNTDANGDFSLGGLFEGVGNFLKGTGSKLWGCATGAVGAEDAFGEIATLYGGLVPGGPFAAHLALVGAGCIAGFLGVSLNSPWDSTG